MKTKKKKYKLPEPKPLERKPILAVKKTALKNIVKTEVLSGRLEDAVQRAHTVLVHTTHFLKLYLLHLYHEKEPLPALDVDFIAVCMRTVSNMPPKQNRRGRPPNARTQKMMMDLDAFYQEHYLPLLGDNPSSKRAPLYKINDLLQYEEKDILKNIKNNIFTHYLFYCKEFVNKTFDLKGRLKAIQEDYLLSEEEKKLSKRAISIEMRLVKEDLLSPLGTAFKCLEQYHLWLNEHKPKIVPKESFRKDNIAYDLKANPLDYLYGMIHLFQELQAFESYHHAIPLRTSTSPCYINIDTTALITLMIDKNALSYRKKVRQVKQEA